MKAVKAPLLTSGEPDTNFRSISSSSQKGALLSSQKDISTSKSLYFPNARMDIQQISKPETGRKATNLSSSQLLNR